jgi:hypothetical protein
MKNKIFWVIILVLTLCLWFFMGANGQNSAPRTPGQNGKPGGFGLLKDGNSG